MAKSKKEEGTGWQCVESTGSRIAHFYFCDIRRGAHRRTTRCGTLTRYASDLVNPKFVDDWGRCGHCLKGLKADEKVRAKKQRYSPPRQYLYGAGLELEDLYDNSYPDTPDKFEGGFPTVTPGYKEISQTLHSSLHALEKKLTALDKDRDQILDATAKIRDALQLLEQQFNNDDC